MRERYAETNGLRMRYLEAGRGDDVLVLLHGGTETAAGCWGELIELFARTHRVIAPDSRGHGGTVNDGRPLSYRLMAEDIAGLCKALGIDHAGFCGFSDGANISLELAMHHGPLVRAAVMHGCIVDFTPLYYEGIADFLGASGPGAPADPDVMAQRHPTYVELLRQWHAPQGSEHWRAVVHLIDPLFTTPLGYVDSDYARADRPLLVLTGDRDPFVTVEEQAALFRRLPDAELAVMAGAGHAFPRDHELYGNVVDDFLARRG